MIIAILFAIGYVVIGSLALLFTVTTGQALVLIVGHIVVNALCILATYNVVTQTERRDAEEEREKRMAANRVHNEAAIREQAARGSGRATDEAGA